jgi:hypothetical protein
VQGRLISKTHGRHSRGQIGIHSRDATFTDPYALRLTLFKVPKPSTHLPGLSRFESLLGTLGDALFQQFAWVDQMFRPEMQARPAAVLFELDSQEVSDFPVDAIANSSG